MSNSALEKLAPVVAEIERDAFQRGWQAAFQHIARQAAQPPIPQQGALSLLDIPDAPTQDETQSVIVLVEDWIKHHPGQPGHEIVKMMQRQFSSRDGRAVERTVRTALARLKARGKIENRNGSWWKME